MKYVQILILFLLPALIACNDSNSTETSSTDASTTTSETSTQKVISEKMGPEQFMKKYADSPGAILIDVRTPEEYADGYVPNAQNINFYDENFKENAGKLDKNKPVFVYCAVGGRSAKAAIALEKVGFTEIYDMSGGYGLWNKMEEEKAAAK